MAETKGYDLLLRNKKKTYLSDYTPTSKNKIVNKKFTSEMTEYDQISIVSNAMFFTMLGNSERKRFICKLLSGLLDVSFEELMENSDYYKNEFDKDTVDAKSERGDLILTINNDFISVEMNLRDETQRNVDYTDKLYRSKVKVGSKYVYPKVLSINLNNFYYEALDKPIDTFYTQNDDNVVLVDKTYIQVYLPLLMKKWYTEGTGSLSDFERSLVTMILTDRNKATELAKGDDILEDYVKEANKVLNNDNFLRESYDHELSMIEAAQEAGHEYGFEEGRETGFEEGQKAGFEEGIKFGKEENYKKLKDSAKSFIQSGVDKETVLKILGLKESDLD